MGRITRKRIGRTTRIRTAQKKLSTSAHTGLGLVPHIQAMARSRLVRLLMHIKRLWRIGQVLTATDLSRI
jgi:hypothetical protein